MLATIAGVSYYDSNLISDFPLAISTYTSSIATHSNIRNVKTLMKTGTVQKVLNNPSTADFTIKDISAGYSFSRGNPVALKDSNTLEVIFTGYINSLDISALSSTLRYHDIHAVGLNYLLKKKYIRKAFENYTADQIVSYIFYTYLEPEGIQIGSIESPGQDPLENKTYDLVTIEDALNDLKDIAGFVWRIDDHSRFYFQPSSSQDAPWDVTSSNIFKTPKVSKDSSNYRNVEYLRGGKAATTTQTETFKGDGETTSFNLAYPVKEVTSIKVDSVAKSVGYQIEGTGHDWYWSPNVNTIQQDVEGVKLTSSNTLEVVYIGLYDLMVKVSDNSAIAARAAIEGGTGIYEIVVDAPEYSDIDSLIEYGRRLISYFGEESVVITYETVNTGLDVGQQQHVTLSKYDLDDDFVINQINIRNKDGLMIYEVSATKGPITDIWQQVFGKKPTSESTGSNSIAIYEDLQKIWTSEGETNNPFAGGASPTDMYKYIEVTATNTKREAIEDLNVEADEIIVTGEIPASADTDVITAVSLWGGAGATSTPGTGTKYYEVSYGYDKTTLELIRFVFDMLKGY